MLLPCISLTLLEFCHFVTGGGWLRLKWGYPTAADLSPLKRASRLKRTSVLTVISIPSYSRLHKLHGAKSITSIDAQYANNDY